MKRIFDPALLDFYLQKHEIPSLFDTPDLAFSLYQFEKGERLDTLNPEEYLSFLVDGSIEISANRADGTSYPIGYLDGFTCTGALFRPCGIRARRRVPPSASAIWNSAENAMIRTRSRHAPPRFVLFCRSLPRKSFC